MGERSYVDVGSEAEFPPGSVLAREVSRRKILICNTPDGLFAVASRCTHSAWSMEGGPLEGCLLVCVLHGGVFDVRDGSPQGGPVSKPLDTYPLRTREGRVEVAVA